MMEEIVHETSWYAFALQETYHTRLSSITRDDICVCTLLTDYQKSTYQQTKSLSSISINHLFILQVFQNELLLAYYDMISFT
jgi:hypothetical protein